MGKIKKIKGTTQNTKKNKDIRKPGEVNDRFVAPDEATRENYDPRINYIEQDKTDLLRNINKMIQLNSDLLRYTITIQTTYICAKCEKETGAFWVNAGKNKDCKTCKISKIKEIVKHEISG